MSYKVIPDQTGNSGKYLKTDGTELVWDSPAGGSGSPGGLNTEVQFNDGGTFGGDAGMTYNKTSNTLTVDAVVLTGGDVQTQINGKQATLVSTTNIKSINGSSILGSGDLTISAGLTQQQIEGLI